MKICKQFLPLILIAGIGALAGCSSESKSSDTAVSVRTGLAQAGLADVTVRHNQEKGVLTLGGHVPTDTDKERAESIARSSVGAQVVSNEIAVIPPGAESEAKKVNAALDRGIESNLEAALVGEKLNDSVKYSVRNHVVTLTGDVNTAVTRERAEKVAAGVLNVEQVVNELQVRRDSIGS